MSGDESKHLQDDHYNVDVTGDEKMVERIISGELSKFFFSIRGISSAISPNFMI